MQIFPSIKIEKLSSTFMLMGNKLIYYNYKMPLSFGQTYNKKHFSLCV